MAAVTITTKNIPNYSFTGTLHELWIISDRSWIANDGTVVQGGVEFAQKVTLSVVGSVATIPQLTLQPQNTSVNGKNASYLAVIYVDGVAKATYLADTLGNFQITATPSPTSWDAIETYNSTVVKNRQDSRAYTADQVNALLATLGSTLAIAANKVIKSDGTTLIASRVEDSGSGSTPVLSLDSAGNVVAGSLAALITTATDGFLYIPSMPGVPTGVPTSKTGKVAMVFDTTNNRLYNYDAGWILAGISNTAGANVIPKSDGTNLVASQLQDNGTVVGVGGLTSAFPSLKRSSTTLQVRLADDSGFASLAAGAATFASNVQIDGLIQLSGATASFPALKRSSTTAQIRLADDSAYAPLEAAAITSSADVTAAAASAFILSARSKVSSPANNSLLLTNNAGGDFSQLMFGGTTSSFPSLKRSGTSLHARLADDSAFAQIQAGALTLDSTLTLASTSLLSWDTRTNISSPANGNLLLRNAALSDFGLLLFGGSTSSFPALKRSSTALQVRLADDSAFAPIAAGPATFTGDVLASAIVTYDLGSVAQRWRQIHSQFVVVGGANSGTGSNYINFPDGGTFAWVNIEKIRFTSPNFVFTQSAAGQFRVNNSGNTSIFTVDNDLGHAFAYGGLSLGVSMGATAPPTNGLRVQGNVQADGLIQFSGVTSLFPALKRSSAELQVRLADDSAFANLKASVINAQNSVEILGLSSSVLTLTHTSASAASIQTGTGDPEAASTANTGSLFVRTDGGVGTSLYVKEVGSGNLGWFSLRQVLDVRTTAGFSKTNDTTLANITGLTHNVKAARVYEFEAILYTTSDVAGGVKFSIAGTATATSIVYEALVFNGAAASAQTRATTLGTAVGGVTAVTVAYCRITGTIEVNAAGTLTVQFAQNASNAAASTVLTNSTFRVTAIS